ncbi:MAG: Glu-tRNA(Gln) amidotransferase subunit GatE, partial [Candidatus Hydrothermarchaeaceae archaeon]
LAIKLEGFRGLLIKRLGPEFAGYAKAVAGAGGIFHTDELPAYGLSKKEVDRVSKKIKLAGEDAFVLVAESEETARKALTAVFDRAKAAFDGVPEETRMANPDGTTSYMRPLPGAARMYPETDIPPVVISDELLDKVRKKLPESYEDKISRYIKKYKLSEEMASQMVSSSWPEFFEETVKETGATPSIIANTLLGTLKEQKREGIEVENIPPGHLKKLFKYVASGKMAKEAIPGATAAFAASQEEDFKIIIDNLDISSFGEDEISEIVQKIIKDREAFVKEKGLASIGPLMGPVMEEVRGRVDGKLANDILKREIERFLHDV